jgi:hypothetical protein
MRLSLLRVEARLDRAEVRELLATQRFIDENPATWEQWQFVKQYQGHSRLFIPG